MASPSASSATLSIHSSQYGESWDKTNSSSENGSTTDKQLEPTFGRREDGNGSHFKEKIQDGPASTFENGDFVFPKECVQSESHYSLSPILKAASNRDPRILSLILSFSDDRRIAANELSYREDDIPLNVRQKDADPTNGFRHNKQSFNGDERITAPLMEAIRARLPQNVRMLLEAGAIPDGIPYNVVSKYSAFFLRFRPSIPSNADRNHDVDTRDALLRCMDLPQLAPLTVEEVTDRFWEGLGPFWCEENFTPRDFYSHGDALSSLVEAAKSGSIEIFDQLLAAGANKDFWMGGYSSSEGSGLCISTPLHAAIEIEDTYMVKHLLRLRFDPNCMPLANPTRCVTPLMATLMSTVPQWDQYNEGLFDIIASHPLTNPNIRTPVYRVHILHFAVARLNLRLLQHVVSVTPLSEAETTALGHNLLHIACMPANSLHVQSHSELIFHSIHETRDLSFENDPFIDIPARTSPPSFPRSFYTRHFAAQTDVVKYLWMNGIQEIGGQDVHGNTPLHYLAGCCVMNRELLNWWLIVLKSKEVETVWREKKNAMGATPKDLCGEADRVEGERGWKPWFAREWIRERRARKDGIWKVLLENERIEKWKRNIMSGRGRGRGGMRGRGLGRGSGFTRGRGM